MVKYTIKRMILAIFTTFIILSLTFVLIKMLPFPMPGATSEEACLAYFIKQESLGYVFQSAKKIEGMDALWNYKQGFKTIYFYVKPLGDQYIGWLSNIFTKWDWGVSNQIQPNVEVMAIILSRLPTTVKINIWSVISIINVYICSKIIKLC